MVKSEKARTDQQDQQDQQDPRTGKGLKNPKNPKNPKKPKKKRTSLDRILKKTLQHDIQLTIRLINSLFKARHPLDAEVIWLDKETVDDDNESLIADFFVRVGGKMYAIEVEANDKGKMAFRSSQYSLSGAFLHNTQGTDAEIVIGLPDSCTVFLRSDKDTPKELVWIIEARGNTYRVSNPTVRLCEMSVRDMAKKDLLPLGQFLPRLYYPLTDENLAEFLKQLNEYLRELRKEIDSGKLAYSSAIQMQETIRQFSCEMIKDGRKKGFAMRLKMLDTLDWIDYNEAFDEVESRAIAEGKELGIAEGKELGIEQEKMEVALNSFRNFQLPSEQIVELLRSLNIPEQMIEDAKKQVEEELACASETVPETGECSEMR